MPIAQCYSCGDGICERHARWHEDGYLCTKCANKIGLKEYGTAQRRVTSPVRPEGVVRPTGIDDENIPEVTDGQADEAL